MSLLPRSVSPATLRLCIGLGTGVVVAGATSAAALMVVKMGRSEPAVADAPACYETCALPDGVDLAALPESDRSYLSRRAMLCADFACGRMGAEDYRASLAALESEPEPEACLTPPSPIWADRVVSFSSEYTSESWSARQVLGPPNVYPRSVDDSGAWAPLAEDGGVEVIEVGFSASARAHGVRIAETYNAGAVTQVELITETGLRRVVFEGAAEPIGAAHMRELSFACTDERVVGARVTLSTAAVPGWNEIDAIGLVPCR